MRSSAQDRSILDKRLSVWRDVPSAVPPRGWIRSIRETLGMPRAELARRAHVSGAAIANLERSEAAGSIQLDSLRRVAEALDCVLVYALVPNSSLEETVEQRARTIARRQVGQAQQSMLLEDQRGGDEEVEHLIERIAEQTKNSPALWRD